VSGVRPILLALLLAALPAAAQPSLPGLDPEAQVAVEAQRLTWEEEGIARAEGDVRVASGTIRLAADVVVYDTARGTVQAEGRITVVDGTFVARADRGSFDLATGAGLLEGVSLWEKKAPVEPEAAFGASTDALGLLGGNAIAIRSRSIRRQADGSWIAEHPTVTTCDCGEDPPSWTVGASSARVTPDDRVHLVWPVFYARGIPVAAFPYFAMPLETERQSGLLLPDVYLTSKRGFSWEQPLYLVLGRSYDATLTGGWFFGSTDEQRIPAFLGGPPETSELHRGFKGPRGSAEFRYAPRRGTAGRLFAAYAHDLSYRAPDRGSTVPGTVPDRLPVSNEGTPVEFPVSDPHRFFLQMEHVDDWGDGWGDRLDLNLASDRFYVRDFTDEVVQRSNGVLASSAWLAKREGSLLLEADGTYLQDLRLPFETNDPDDPDGRRAPPLGYLESPELFGHHRRNTFARLPAFAADLARLHLPGGAGLSLHAGAARFAPLTSTGFGDEGTDGRAPGDPGYPGPDPDGTENNGILDEGERAAATRLALRPTLTLPILAGRFLSVTPMAGWREQLYLYDAEEDGHAGYGLLGLDAHTQLARTFAGGTVRHAIVPRLQLRGFFPGGDEAAPARPYDELDVRPLESFGQARLALGTRVDVARDGGGIAVAEAEVGEDFLVAPEASAVASWVRANLSVRPLRLDGILRWERELHELSEVAASASLTADAGHQLRAGYRRLAESGSSRLLAGPDQLFAPGTVDGARLAIDLVDAGLVEALHQVSAGATVVPIRGLSLRYDLLVLATLPSDPILEQRAGLGYLSGCGCWGAELRVAFRRGEPMPDFGFSLDLTGLLQL